MYTRFRKKEEKEEVGHVEGVTDQQIAMEKSIKKTFKFVEKHGVHISHLLQRTRAYTLIETTLT